MHHWTQRVKLEEEIKYTSFALLSLSFTSASLSSAFLIVCSSSFHSVRLFLVRHGHVVSILLLLFVCIVHSTKLVDWIIGNITTTRKTIYNSFGFEVKNCPKMCFIEACFLYFTFLRWNKGVFYSVSILTEKNDSINYFVTGNTLVCGWRFEHAEDIFIHVVSRTIHVVPRIFFMVF